MLRPNGAMNLAAKIGVLNLQYKPQLLRHRIAHQFPENYILSLDNYILCNQVWNSLIYHSSICFFFQILLPVFR
jgi:hypothetical protein